jgi:hypothetical protein
MASQGCLGQLAQRAKTASRDCKVQPVQRVKMARLVQRAQQARMASQDCKVQRVQRAKMARPVLPVRWDLRALPAERLAAALARSLRV